MAAPWRGGARAERGGRCWGVKARAPPLPPRSAGPVGSLVQDGRRLRREVMRAAAAGRRVRAAGRVYITWLVGAAVGGSAAAGAGSAAAGAVVLVLILVVVVVIVLELYNMTVASRGLIDTMLDDLDSDDVDLMRYLGDPYPLSDHAPLWDPHAWFRFFDGLGL